MKENKSVKVQIRITSTEKALLDKLIDINKDLSISKIFRDALQENCQKYNIKIEEIPPKTEDIVITSPTNTPA